jgi:hypothetical protein
VEILVSWLVRLYPPSWRKRYGLELEVLIQDMPGHLGTALDLVIGAAIAYRDVVRGNRVLNAAGAYLHGLTVAVLLQAILFVGMILAGQRAPAAADFRLGPFDFATFSTPVSFGEQLRALGASLWFRQVALPIATEVLVLVGLVGALAFVVAIPRLARSLK